VVQVKKFIILSQSIFAASATITTIITTSSTR